MADELRVEGLIALMKDVDAINRVPTPSPDKSGSAPDNPAVQFISYVDDTSVGQFIACGVGTRFIASVVGVGG